MNINYSLKADVSGKFTQVLSVISVISLLLEVLLHKYSLHNHPRSSPPTLPEPANQIQVSLQTGGTVIHLATPVQTQSCFDQSVTSSIKKKTLSDAVDIIYFII